MSYQEHKSKPINLKCEIPYRPNNSKFQLKIPLHPNTSTNQKGEKFNKKNPRFKNVGERERGQEVLGKRRGRVKTKVR